jgi:hypothetical protein
VISPGSKSIAFLNVIGRREVTSSTGPFAYTQRTNNTQCMFYYRVVLRRIAGVVGKPFSAVWLLIRTNLLWMGDSKTLVSSFNSAWFRRYITFVRDHKNRAYYFKKYSYRSIHEEYEAKLQHNNQQ